MHVYIHTDVHHTIMVIHVPLFVRTHGRKNYHPRFAISSKDSSVRMLSVGTSQGWW